MDADLKLPHDGWNKSYAEKIIGVCTISSSTPRRRGTIQLFMIKFILQTFHNFQKVIKLLFIEFLHAR